MGRKEKAELCYKRGKRQNGLPTSTLIVHNHVAAIKSGKNKCVRDVLSVQTDASSW